MITEKTIFHSTLTDADYPDLKSAILAEIKHYDTYRSNIEMVMELIDQFYNLKIDYKAKALAMKEEYADRLNDIVEKLHKFHINASDLDDTVDSNELDNTKKKVKVHIVKYKRSTSKDL